MSFELLEVKQTIQHLLLQQIKLDMSDPNHLNLSAPEEKKQDGPHHPESGSKFSSPYTFVTESNHIYLGPLKPVLDPVGKGLGTVLSPVGAVVSGITKPVTHVVGSVTKPALGPVAGTHEEKAEVLGGGNKDSYEHGKDGLGGRLQTGDNPLGLDQTGKFGFRDD
jgi:hypothetical protein